MRCEISTIKKGLKTDSLEAKGPKWLIWLKRVLLPLDNTYACEGKSRLDRLAESSDIHGFVVHA